MKRVIFALAAMLGLLGVFAPTASAAVETPINQCVGTWSVVVGGLSNNDSIGFLNMNQRVGYNSFDTRSGVNELNRLTRDHRRFCPGDHIKMVGHSGGAAVVHVWLTENGTGFGNINAVLLADPKRPAGPGGSGFAQTDFPFNLYPLLAGADNFYSGVPVWTVCNDSDHICNSWATWDGYFVGGTHDAYDKDVDHYSDWGNGQDYRWF